MPQRAGMGQTGSLVALTLVQPAGAPNDDDINDPDQVVSVGKTGTAPKDLPANVQVIPCKLLAEQGVTMLRQSLGNASGVNVGGQDTKGDYDPTTS
ncbi:hypothetical protein [Burkholderia plantarii]|uniref:hypothetical protein n=1 Tax=Burkholderia plantarii TaxID=41899 RepID=UPI0018DB405D|nr:hypothetical protein [Burkholderia plantarii]MBI0329563.1 hypothetical protein [Burkholderia plantarii]